MRNKLLSALMGMLLFAGGSGQAQATIWTTPIAGGEVLFNDWGYTGPDGRTAMDFDPINGFNGATQIQRVVTVESDGVTPDDPQTLWKDFVDPTKKDPIYHDANMDTMTNFYAWGYTSPAGSTFSNMQIDQDGDYLIKRDDMAFNYYESIDYTNMDPAGNGAPTADGLYDAGVEFQPYALSDATGWCGSVMTSNPGSLEAMAGQVTFDFGFEAFMPWVSETAREPGTGSMQIVKDFQMRSYGTLEVITTAAGGGTGDFHYTANAVVNNTDAGVDPVTGAGMVSTPVLNQDGTPALDANGVPRFIMVEEKAVGAGGVDPNSYNEVSFMGGGIVPELIWILMKPGTTVDSADNILSVLDVDENGDPIIPIDPETGLPMVGDLVHHRNSFAGYPFLLRADGIRIIEALDFSLYSDMSGVPAGALDGVVDLSAASAVPVPAAVWLFGSGLIGLLGVARRRV